MFLKCLYILIAISCFVKCDVFLWSNNKEWELNPLQKFTDDEFSFLLQTLDFPEVKAYNHPDRSLPFKFKDLIVDSFSAYNTNDELININATDLTGDEEADFLKIKEDLDDAKKENSNMLFVISTLNRRSKRQINEEERTEESVPNGPVVYIGKSKNEDKYGIIYSSSPLILKINKTDSIYLGETRSDMISLDIQKVQKEPITRLSVSIPQGDGLKITLRFIFTWIDYYWFLTSVKVTDTNDNAYNLTIDKEVSALQRFSYHCSGTTVFSDITNDILLKITNMQVQIDAKEERFDDAYDCVPFTTIPIWSGIVVSSLLIFGLFIAIIALVDIKTMDKFDNYKTKLLPITVSE